MADRLAMMRKNWSSFAVIFTETANKRMTLQCAQHLHSHMQLDRAQNVLEIAAGAGLGSLDVAQYLLDGFSKVPRATKKIFTVTDLSPVMVKMVEENLKGVDSNGVDIQCIEDLTELATGSMDRYISSLCLQLAPDPDATLHEAKRVLTTDGIAGFTIWGSPDLSGTFAINVAANKELGLEENTAGHSNLILGRDPPALRQKFAKAGFNHVQISPFQCVVELWSGEEFAKLHHEMFPLEKGQEELRAKRFAIVKRMASERSSSRLGNVHHRSQPLDTIPKISETTYPKFAFRGSARSMSSASRRLDAVQRHLSSPSPMSYKSPVTSHILDTSVGRPAANVRVELQRLEEKQSGSQWSRVNDGRTNADGRVTGHLVPEASTFEAGTYRMVFYTQEYFEANGVHEFFYPEVTIAFVVKDPTQHYHVPLLINPFGYSTYRGS